ncbi:tRNA pseudouridine32 synthase/23S rRNA pseudouridine746 synthase [Sphingomonas kaistensis]|uniref:tRNA pseudouridine32 synthase/23S rRNA pseudouridine746 synthase n=1 Tax=Sphingomonas kaistensis TaxID=298708 RepID=A0A7X5Y8D4_9SPHN|nr:RNA pseudouridine synthase [Sphingomonas kaistensis]NJC05396.1 tRNA pseudouridine32 synthase/23S rRNA pseudouridine746 synthase [Sphingomonas kaistensis]
MLLSSYILFIDGEAFVLDKPAGLPVDTPKRGGDSIERRLDELRFGFKRFPTAMHRLDQDTSGCLVFARHPAARAKIQQAFEAGAVEKTYLALLAGTLDADEGEIDLPLAKKSSAEAGWKMIGDSKGQRAVTRWRKIAERDGRTLVEFRPLTGRTHQIRVHAREGLGAGIVGDRVYGTPGGPMLLHASRLVVPRGGKPPIDVTAPLPDHWGEWADLVPQAVVPVEEVAPPSTELETGAAGMTPAEPSAGDEA